MTYKDHVILVLCLHLVNVAGISIHEAAHTGNVDRIKELSMEASSLMKYVVVLYMYILYLKVLFSLFTRLVCWMNVDIHHSIVLQRMAH